MNVVTNALKQSSLYQSAIQGGNVDYSAYQYDLAVPYVNCFKDFHTKHAVDGIKNFGDSASVELSAFGILRNMYIKWEIAYTNGSGGASGSETAMTPNVAKHLYAQIIKRVSLLNSSREIMQIHGDLIQFKTISIEDAGEKAKWLLAGSANLQLSKASLQNLGNETQAREVVVAYSASEKTHTFYSKIPFSMFEGRFQSDDSKKTGLNLRFAEVLRLNIETNPAFHCIAGTGSGATTTTTCPIINPRIKTCEVYCHYDILETNDNQIVEKQFSLSTPLSMLNGNCVLTEASVSATSNETEHTVKIYNTNLIQNFVVMVHGERTLAKAQALGKAINLGTSNGTDGITAVADGSTGATARANMMIDSHQAQHHSVNDTVNSVANTECSRIGADLKKLNSLNLSSSGRVIFEANDYKQLLLTTTNQCNWLNVSAGYDREIGQTMDKFNCNDTNFYIIPFSESPHTNSLTGNLALKGLSTVDLTVKFPSKTGNKYTIKVFSNYSQITSLDSHSGRLIQSVSS